MVTAYWRRMANPTPYLPGFSHRLCGRRAISAAERINAQAISLDGLAALVARFIPAEVLAPADGQRERVFTPWVTFIAFLGQVLTRGSACREVVRRVQSWCVASRQALPDENSSAYCLARKRLTLRACGPPTRRSAAGSHGIPGRRIAGVAER